MALGDLGESSEKLFKHQLSYILFFLVCVAYMCVCMKLHTSMGTCGHVCSYRQEANLSCYSLGLVYFVCLFCDTVSHGLKLARSAMLAAGSPRDQRSVLLSARIKTMQHLTWLFYVLS